MEYPSVLYILAAIFIIPLVYQSLVVSDPLSRIPGPVLAKWTRFYRIYYDIALGGKWLPHLEYLHQKYGPVVRVGRNELHFADPAAYADIYSSPAKFPKDPHLYSVFEFGLPSSLFTSINQKDHAVLKSMLGSFFSKQSILKLENVIQERVDKLLSQLTANHKYTPASMHLAFRSATLDIITIYSYRTSLDVTSYPSFRHPILLSINDRIGSTWIFRHFPILVPISNNLPTWLSAFLMPSSKAQLEVLGEVAKLVDEALQNAQDPDSGDHDDDSNMFHTIIHNAGTKYRHKITREYLICEGLDLRIAGSDTVGNTCAIGTRALVRDERVRNKLIAELDEAWPDKDSRMPLERLEKLPYLTAVIKESLRLSHGVVTPMNRIVTNSEASIAGHYVPPGTIVSIANPFVHLNPDIFPEPHRFYPERWIEAKDHSLDRYLVTFGKGPRSCIGINLAWSELYMILGNLFRKLELKSSTELGSEVKFKEIFVPVFERDLLNVTVVERPT